MSKKIYPKLRKRLLADQSTISALTNQTNELEQKLQFEKTKNFHLQMKLDTFVNTTVERNPFAKEIALCVRVDTKIARDFPTVWDHALASLKQGINKAMREQ